MDIWDIKFKNIRPCTVTQKMKLLDRANKICTGLTCWNLQNAN